MAALREAVDNFLAQRRIAVAGVSQDPKQAANFIYRRFRDRGYQVFPVNPTRTEVEGDTCYPDVLSIPGGVTAVLIATRPEVAERVVEDCAAAGVTRVWMHRSAGVGSVSERAAADARARGITVIAGGCPLMFGRTADVGHRLMCLGLRVAGRLPKNA